MGKKLRKFLLNIRKSCRKLWYCLPRRRGVTFSIHRQVEGRVLLGCYLVLPHGCALLLLIKQKQFENLPDDQLASNGWKVSQ